MKNKIEEKTEYWISKWDKMQEYYNPDRIERFTTLISLLKSKYKEPEYILDIGCGTGSLMYQCVEAFPSVHVAGIDLDFTLLQLAKARLEKTTSHFAIFETDLRKHDWNKLFPYQFDAIISATALHWLDENDLSMTYQHIHNLLKVDGLFLNADHTGSPDHSIQNYWKNKKETITSKDSISREPWNLFWDEYLKDFNDLDIKRRNDLIGKWNGIEEGMPLFWHFKQLETAGFKYVDCFYRFNGDAIYGGIKTS